MCASGFVVPPHPFLQSNLPLNIHSKLQRQVGKQTNDWLWNTEEAFMACGVSRASLGLWFISNFTSLSHLSCPGPTAKSFTYLKECLDILSASTSLLGFFFSLALHINSHSCWSFKKLVKSVCLDWLSPNNPRCWALWSEVIDEQSIWIKVNRWVCKWEERGWRS